MSGAKGKVHPQEAEERRDARTGARVVRITRHDSINHHLYPLTCSTTPDMGWVVFASSRTGSWQFFKAGFPNGPIVQLTDCQEGVHGYSGHLTTALKGARGRELVYTAGAGVPSGPGSGGIRAVHLESFAERSLGRWEGASLGEVSLCASGEWLVTAMKWRGRSFLVVARTDGSGAEPIFECERTIIHPQFHPRSDDLIEYAQDPAPRLWLIRRDGSCNTCLYEHGNDEFVVHETWLGETGDLVFTHWPFALRRLSIQKPEVRSQNGAGRGREPQHSTIAAFNAWHIAPNRAGTLVLCDTNHPDIGLQMVGVASGELRTLCHPDASSRGSQWRTSRYALREDFDRAGREEGALSWMEAKSDTVYGPQWTHPHPSWSADERWCLYDSDTEGTTQVYAVEVPRG